MFWFFGPEACGILAIGSGTYAPALEGSFNYWTDTQVPAYWSWIKFFVA